MWRRESRELGVVIWDLRALLRRPTLRPRFNGRTFSLNSSHSFPVSFLEAKNAVSGSTTDDKNSHSSSFSDQFTATVPPGFAAVSIASSRNESKKMRRQYTGKSDLPTTSVKFNAFFLSGFLKINVGRVLSLFFIGESDGG